MNKVYLVISNYSNQNSGNIDIQNIIAFDTYEKAKEYFEKEKAKIKSFDLGYDEIEEIEDYYCESINGEYLYYHELVYIEEKEVF